MEVSLLLKNSKNVSFYLRSLLSIPTRSISIFPQTRSEPSAPAMSESPASRQAVKCKMMLPSKILENDFMSNPIFEVPITVRVDCSNLPTEGYDHIYIRFFNANEKRSKHQIRPTIDINYENSPFSWAGKTRIKIEKQDAYSAEELKKLKVCKEKDWSDTQALLGEIPNIIHYAIVDTKTGETWLKSSDFEF